MPPNLHCFISKPRGLRIWWFFACPVILVLMSCFAQSWWRSCREVAETFATASYEALWRVRQPILGTWPGRCGLQPRYQNRPDTRTMYVPFCYFRLLLLQHIHVHLACAGAWAHYWHPYRHEPMGWTSWCETRIAVRELSRPQRGDSVWGSCPLDAFKEGRQSFLKPCRRRWRWEG